MAPILTLLLSLLLEPLALATNPPPPTDRCTNLQAPPLPGLTILSFTTTPLLNHTVPATPPFLTTAVPNLTLCEVNIALTHPPANDTVNIQLWLPLSPSSWNTRFLALGGSAWAAGLGPFSLAPYTAQGFATGSTDAGVGFAPLSPAGWAIKDGKVDEVLLENFAGRAVHELAVVGKAVAEGYYGRKPGYAYWNGCSTGGRQGVVAAQRFPGDFDGIVAGAPALYWTRYLIGELWPQVVMREVGYYPTTCEFQAVRGEVVKECDGLDGVRDGVISELGKCTFGVDKLVGRTVTCGEGEVEITGKLAEVVKKIWEGPKTAEGKRLWYGLTRGAPLETLAANHQLNGTAVGDPFFVAQDWIRYFVKTDPTFDLSGLSPAILRQLFDESVEKLAAAIDSSDPDLSGLQRAGGKLLIWHGEADNIIFPQASIQYREEVQKKLGLTARRVDDFFRLFIAPGVDHCGQGTIDGAAPTDPLAALISWVEKKKAPQELAAATLPTAKTQFTRKLCPFPLVAKYDGHGDPTKAESFQCAKGCGRS
ncbi:tannase and feruloyl esterase [Staphylotrichum tortipilum]|uniref:Carboxylic ester hydrolase n=1 Tax=Staphylotrichum tortipilum TaxID=2831512 RepID=A0AAN6MFW3_9PEZI|nr:tannase and feruloyl esterase [Staphylotrichum longicolle]